MHIWFWGWLLLAGIFGVLELVDRRHLVLPWAIGAFTAALLEALGVWIGWQWVALVLVSSAVLVGIHRFRAPGRRSLGGHRAAHRRSDAPPTP